MEQQDYLKKQIDQLGKVLSELISNLFGQSITGRENEIISIAAKTLKTEIGKDINELLEIPQDSFIERLKSLRNINDNNLNTLAELFFSIAFICFENETKYKLFNSALTIYEYLDKIDSTYNLDRHFKIERIKVEISRKH